MQDRSPSTLSSAWKCGNAGLSPYMPLASTLNVSPLFGVPSLLLSV